MPDSFNPFHHWLGLSPKIKNPHHFQLLGVSPKLADQKQIEAAVEAGVRRNAEMLAKVPPGKHDALLKQMKQRIALARKTLLNPKLRADYVNELKAKIKAQQEGKTSGSQNQGTAPKQDAAPPPSAPPTVTPPAAVTPSTAETPIEPPETPLAQPATSISSVPAAIPLAVPIQPDSEDGATVAVPVAAAIPTQSDQSADDSPFGNVQIDAKRGRKRKRSALGNVIAVIMVVAAGVGAFLVYQNFESLMRLGGINPDVSIGPGINNEDEPEKQNPDDDSSNDDETILDPGQDDATPGKKPSKLPTFDLDSLPELTESDLADVMDGAGNKPKQKDPDGDMSDQGVSQNNDPPEMVNDDVDPDADKTPVQLDASQIAELRKDLQRARRSMFRRDEESATNALQSAQQLLDDTIAPESEVVAADQRPLARLVGDTEEALRLLDGFWEQVVNSCQNIPGGQEITIGQQVVGFLEADQEKFTVRNSGTNITYEYSFCPPGLAMKLAIQGAIPDIPTWSKQLAAFYAVNQVDGIDHAEKIDELLKIAEDAGHDCDGIRRFAIFDFGNMGLPDSKVDPPEEGELDQAVAEFREESSYKEIKKLTPGMAGLYSEFLLQIDSPNFKQHVAFLDEARKLAIYGGEAFKMEDAVLEMGIYANIDVGELMLSSYTELAKGKNTPEQTRQMMEGAIPFLKSSLAQSLDAKPRGQLAKRLLKIAKANNMLDSVRRLNQLDR